MALGPFAESKALTFGVELELQLVSLSDFDLTSPASPWRRYRCLSFCCSSMPACAA